MSGESFVGDSCNKTIGEDIPLAEDEKMIEFPP